jgi:hypothetical protein
VHADGTVAGCSLDNERDGCRGRELRHALQVIAGTLFGFSAAFDRLIHAYGWDPAHWGALVLHSLNKLRPAMAEFGWDGSVD